MKKIIKKYRTIIDILVILFVAIILCYPHFISSLDVYTDDGIQHISRAFGTFESIKENGLFTKIINSFSNGFGYSWDLFYGPITTIAIIIFKFISPSYIVAYKITTYVFYALSGIFMYKLVKSMLKNNNAGLLAAVLYLTFPYHLTDLFTRNALGEFASFAFIPMVFLGINNIIDKSKDTKHYLAYGAIGLILTHNISALVTAIFAFIYLMYHFDKLNKKEQLISIVKEVIFIILVTLFFVLPLLETRFSANYAVYDSNMMSSEELVVNNELRLKQLIVTENGSGFVFELGPHIIIMLCLSVMTFSLLTKHLKERYSLFFIFGVISLWMCTKYFPWKYLPEQFLIIQFPWRMMTFVSFFFSIICAINIYAVIKKFNIKDVIVISIISIIYTLIFVFVMPLNDDITDISSYDNIGKFTGKDKEVVIGCGKGEYLPLAAYENRFYIATREDTIYVLEGKATITEEVKDASSYCAKIETYDSDYTIFEFPFIYYPGYEIRFDGIYIQGFETKNGFLGCAIWKNDDGDLTVDYTGTKITHISSFISIISFIGLIGYTIYGSLKDKKEKNSNLNKYVVVEKKDKE